MTDGTHQDWHDDVDSVLTQAEKILTPVTLPSGRVVQNRLIKVSRMVFQCKCVWSRCCKMSLVDRLHRHVIVLISTVKIYAHVADEDSYCRLPSMSTSALCGVQALTLPI